MTVPDSPAPFVMRIRIPGPRTGTAPAVVAMERESVGSTFRSRCSTDTSLTTFTVRPGFGIVKTLNGGHQLVISPNAICDLSSSYGPTEWDQPCQPAKTPVTITARTWVEANGHPRVDFMPRLRFAPSDRANAILYLMDKVAADDPAYRIFYCADNASDCVDESLTDPTLATQRDVRGFLYRRIKHFSGYNIASGYAE